MTDKSQTFSSRLELVAHDPGVYLMKDASGSVIYVGKANDLRQRLRSYFTALPRGNARILSMISQIDDFSVIICENEQEALFLESTLIKKYMPRYNVLLRDDKDYPYIRVTMNEEYPRILKAFRIGTDQKLGARYFGPYRSRDVALALEAIRAIFPLKICRRMLPRDIGKERPCLQYFIGRCVGPCKGDVPADVYRSVMEQICFFLEGRTTDILDELQEQMHLVAEQLDFEKAARLRDRIQALKNLMEKQTVVDPRPVNRDVLATFSNGTEICLQKLEIRQGRLIGTAATFWPDENLGEQELVRSFMVQHYSETAWIPPEILVPVDLAEKEALETFLSKLRGAKCQVRRPQRGQGRRLLQMAVDNARESLRRHTLEGGSRRTAVDETLKLLGTLVGLNHPPHRIEAIDISHLGGTDRSAALVVFLAGRPDRRHYRHFRLREDSADDYDAMRQVLTRRLKRLGDDSFGQTPDLILADGGLGHVLALKAILDEQSLKITVAGMVKDERHRTRALVLADGRTIELKNMPAAHGLKVEDADPDDALAAEEKMALLRLLTAIQNEAHRFANRYRNKLAKKRHTRFSLETIKGVGPKRRKLLLEHFHSLKKISEADLEELAAVKGIGPQAALAIYSHFHAGDKEG